jgi:hypothetical protein
MMRNPNYLINAQSRKLIPAIPAHGNQLPMPIMTIGATSTKAKTNGTKLVSPPTKVVPGP